MKIAIVTGGFEGVRRQKRIWDLEREIDEAKQKLLDTVALGRTRRSHLMNLQNGLAAAGPSKEVK